MTDITKEQFTNLLETSPTVYHFVFNAKRMLLEKGFIELNEKQEWKDIPNKFFVIRDDRSLIAINKHNFSTGTIVTTHIDSPCFRCKPNSWKVSENLEQVAVDRYGEFQYATWLDHDLKISGKVILHQDGQIIEKLIDTGVIGSMAGSTPIYSQSRSGSPVIPMKYLDKYNPIVHIINSPYHEQQQNVSESTSESTQDAKQSPTFIKVICKECNCQPNEIINFDLYFTSAEKASFIGPQYIRSSRLNGMASAIPSFYSFLQTNSPFSGCSIFYAFDNEEVGSKSRSGSSSSFLTTVLTRAGAPESFFRNVLIISSSVGNANHIKGKLTPGNEFGPGLIYQVPSSPSTVYQANPLLIAKKIAVKYKIKLTPIIDTNDPHESLASNVANEFCSPSLDIGIPILGMGSIRETAVWDNIVNMKMFIEKLITEYNNN